MDFLITPLDAERFRPLLRLDDAALADHDACWLAVDRYPGYPCAVSLQEALKGERVLAVHVTHHEVDGPWRASGTVLVREHADTVHLDTNAVPPMLHQRELALRAWGADGAPCGAQLLAGSELEQGILELLANDDAEVLHAHDAASGGYLCRINRAGGRR